MSTADTHPCHARDEWEEPRYHSEEIYTADLPQGAVACGLQVAYEDQVACGLQVA